MGEGGGGEGGSSEGEDDAVARSTGGHCGGQAKVRQYSLVRQVLEPAELTSRSTSVNLLATLGFGTCGLLLLVVNDQNLRAATHTFPNQNLSKSPGARIFREI